MISFGMCFAAAEAAAATLATNGNDYSHKFCIDYDLVEIAKAIARMILCNICHADGIVTIARLVDYLARCIDECMVQRLVC